MEKTDQVMIVPQKLYSIWNDPQTLGVLAAICVIVISLIFYSLYRKKISKKNSILLLGLCEAGKTLIFSRLVYKKYVQTHTSVKANLGDYVRGPVTFNIIDIPGHERLRNKFFDQFKSLARGLVFVVDSLTIQRDIKDVAEFLYNCLTDNYIANNTPPLLILCNKQGEAFAKSSLIIKMSLEGELNILRTTQNNQLQSLGKATDAVFLGKKGKDFSFSHLSPMKVDFAECSALISQEKSEFELSSLENWIQSLA